MLNGLVRRIGVACEEGPRTWHFVGRDARPGARAAHHDGPIDVPTHDGFGRGKCEIGIIDRRCGSVGAEIDERQVWLGGQPVQEQFLEIEAGVVRGNGNAHGSFSNQFLSRCLRAHWAMNSGVKFRCL